MNRMQWWTFAAIFFMLGVLFVWSSSFFSADISTDLVLVHFIERDIGTLLIGLAIAFGIAGSFEKDRGY